MQANLSIYSMIRKARIDGAGLVPILIRIDLDRSPVAYYKAGQKAYRIPLACWDDQARQVSARYPNAQLINLALSKRKMELEQIFLMKENQGLKLNKQRIQRLVKGIEPGRCFYAFCRQQIKEKHDNKETIRTYSSEVTKLELFRKDLSFNDIGFTFLQAYRAYMRDELKNEPNTIWKTFKFMNTMMRDAIKIGGIIDKNPFETFDRGSYKQTTRTFLTKLERERLEAVLYKKIPAELYRVIVYQLFMCYAGLRFEDAMAFNYELHIVDDERLIMETQKAKEQVNIKLFPKLREVLVYVQQHPLSITNQEFNLLLKVAASMAGINKNLTAHVGRHSFGRMLAENGVDIKKAQKLLGHRDERSTRIYFHLLDTDVDKEVDDKLRDV